MSEMIERVARALMAAKFKDDPHRVGLNANLADTMGPPAFWMDLARAAIAAMREPTDRMKAAVPWMGWREMIDAALEPVDED